MKKKQKKPTDWGTLFVELAAAVVTRAICGVAGFVVAFMVGFRLPELWGASGTPAMEEFPYALLIAAVLIGLLFAAIGPAVLHALVERIDN